MTPGRKKIEASPGATRASDALRANAANCAELAETAADEPTYRRYKRMEAAWLALAEDQDWLDGERPPLEPARSVSEIQNRKR